MSTQRHSDAGAECSVEFAAAPGSRCVFKILSGLYELMGAARELARVCAVGRLRVISVVGLAQRNYPAESREAFKRHIELAVKSAGKNRVRHLLDLISAGRFGNARHHLRNLGYFLACLEVRRDPLGILLGSGT